MVGTMQGDLKSIDVDFDLNTEETGEEEEEVVEETKKTTTKAEPEK